MAAALTSLVCLHIGLWQTTKVERTIEHAIAMKNLYTRKIEILKISTIDLKEHDLFLIKRCQQSVCYTRCLLNSGRRFALLFVVFFRWDGEKKLNVNSLFELFFFPTCISNSAIFPWHEFRKVFSLVSKRHIQEKNSSLFFREFFYSFSLCFLN